MDHYLSNLIRILRKSCSSNEIELLDAQKFLQREGTENEELFLLTLSEILGNTEIHNNIRVTAGDEFKKHFTEKLDVVPKKKSSNFVRWNKLAVQTREAIKSNILHAVEVPSSPESGAISCLALIAVPELQADRWQGLLERLAGKIISNQSTVAQKLAAINVIENICKDHKQLSDQERNLVLTALMIQIRIGQTNVSLRSNALVALGKLTDIIGVNIKNEVERNYIMTQLTAAATSLQQPSVSINALRCLSELILLYYQDIESFMPKLLKPLSEVAVQAHDQQIALVAIVFWMNVCRAELKNRKKKVQSHSTSSKPISYALSAAPALVPQIFTNLTLSIERQDTGLYNLFDMSAGCLEALIDCCKDAITPNILAVIESNIQSDVCRMRASAIYMLGVALISGVRTQKIKMLVENNVTDMINQVLHANKLYARKIALEAIWEIFRAYPECLVYENIRDDLINVIIQSLHISSGLAVEACFLCGNLARAAKEQYQIYYKGPFKTSSLSHQFKDIANALWSICEEANRIEMRLGLSAFVALQDLMSNVPLDCYADMQHVASIVLQHLDNTKDMKEHENNSYVKPKLCQILTICFQKMQMQDVAKMSHKTMFLVLRLLSNPQTLLTTKKPLLSLVASLATCLKTRFLVYMDAFWPIWIRLIKDHENRKTCTCSLRLTTALCRGLQNYMSIYCTKLVGILFNLLDTPHLNRVIMVEAIIVIGQVAYCAGKEFSPFANDMVQVLAVATQVSVKSFVSKRDYLTYIESIMTTYRNIAVGLKKVKLENILAPHLRLMAHFLKRIAKNSDITDSTVAAIAGLIHDFRNYKDELLELGHDNNMRMFLLNGSESPKLSTKKLCWKAAKVINELNNWPPIEF